MPTLNWIGKEKVINHHLDVPFKILNRKYSFDSVNGQTSDDNQSENCIIHGDNLEALKALLPKYEGKVKCIYIDPPYNTGNESWVYNDNVNDPKIKKWLGEVVGKEGEDLSRHDKWLCMMYPRLKLLQKLLTEDGGIFISIDDNEQTYLKLICDEIFGKNNFITTLIWEKTDSPKMDAKLFSSKHDFIIVYAKNLSSFTMNRIKTEEIAEHYNKTDANGRRFYLKPLRAMGKNDARSARPNLYYPLKAPDGTAIFPIRSDGSDGNWRWGREKFENNLNLIQWVKGRKGWTPYYKIFADEQKERQVETIWFHKEVGSNRTSMRELKMLFGGEKNFNTPKPISLVERIVEICTLENSIVLDCFAGSGTTAQAVMNMNEKDGGKRKFILIESENFIESITAERVRRVAQGYSGISGTGGDFCFYEMGESLFNNQRMLNESIDIEKIREYIWYMETRQDYKNNLPESLGKYFLGTNQGTDYYFFYEKDDTTILNFDFLSTLQKKASAYVIFADVCTIDEKELMRLNISFKKIPRDISKL